MNDSRRKKVLCPIEKKDGKTFWMRIGAAFLNRDGSWNVHLDAYPINNRLQIRDLDERDNKQAAGGSREPGTRASQDALPF